MAVTLSMLLADDCCEIAVETDGDLAEPQHFPRDIRVATTDDGFNAAWLALRAQYPDAEVRFTTHDGEIHSHR